MRTRVVLTPLILLCGLAVYGAAQAGPSNWPRWRGPEDNGVSLEKNLPLHWSASENIAWKLALPGRSGSTPIVWGDRIFLNVTEGQNLALWAVDRKTGKLAWQRPLGGGNRSVRKANMSSPSPVTDGRSIWALTSTGLLRRFDFEGREIWQRDFQKDYGPWGLQWGYGSSPVPNGDALFIQVLHGYFTDDPSYVMRIDKETGKTMWRVVRPTQAVRESPDSYTTPAIVKAKSGLELVVTGGDCVTGHDLETGKELWRVNGMNPTGRTDFRLVASPIAMDDLVFAPSRERPLLAIRAGGRGDVSQSHRVWSTDLGPDVPTPLTDGKYLYIIRDNGVMICFDAGTGMQVYAGQRLPSGTYTASPVLADGRIYITNEDGMTSVVKAGPQFEILAKNDLGQYTLSSPAVANGQIFIRTDNALWAIGKAAN